MLGLDSSPNMLHRRRACALPSAQFRSVADASTWVPGQGVDLVFANAIYQWVPDHLSVLPKVLAALPPGGVLAVQMPDNMAEPSHRLMREIAASGPWAEAAQKRMRRADAAAAGPCLLRRAEAVREAGSDAIWHTAYNLRAGRTALRRSSNG